MTTFFNHSRILTETKTKRNFDRVPEMFSLFSHTSTKPKCAQPPLYSFTLIHLPHRDLSAPAMTHVWRRHERCLLRVFRHAASVTSRSGSTVLERVLAMPAAASSSSSEAAPANASSSASSSSSSSSDSIYIANPMQVDRTLVLHHTAEVPVALARADWVRLIVRDVRAPNCDEKRAAALFYRAVRAQEEDASGSASGSGGGLSDKKPPSRPASAAVAKTQQRPSSAKPSAGGSGGSSSNSSDADEKLMLFPHFFEALCALALERDPNPFAAAADRVDAFLMQCVYPPLTAPAHAAASALPALAAHTPAAGVSGSAAAAAATDAPSSTSVRGLASAVLALRQPLVLAERRAA
jgi:hypothetical protein